jgi:predicted DCC family thiol-disulfide oxidoreductase YuxK
MDSLTVYYDAGCELCMRARRWLERQPAFVPLRFVPAGSAAARASCPLEPADMLERLTVVGSDGSVYRGEKAWIMCLWALRGYRSWAMSLSHELLLPVARRFCAFVSRNRYRFGRTKFPTHAQEQENEGVERTTA